MWLFLLGQVHIVSSSGAPTRGGSPLYHHSTPIAVVQGWTPGTAKRVDYFAGGPPLQHGELPLFSAYQNADETIPITIDALDADNLAQILQKLKIELASASFSTPIVWRMRPYAASNEVYAEVYAGDVFEKTTDNQLSAAEGWGQIDAEIVLVRSPFFASADLKTLVNAVTITNDGDPESLGELFGDMIREGEPLTIRLDKPTSMAASAVLLATIYSHTKAQIDQSKTTNSTTIGTSYTASSAIDISALRTRRALSLRVLARLTTLTAPTKAQLKVSVQTAAGSTLWDSAWVTLGSGTSTQLVDLGDATLDALRTPLGGTLSVQLVATLRSTDGTSVTAFLDYLDALLVYDCCTVEAASGLAAGQHYELLGAQNMNGGGYQPMIPEGALVVDASLVPIKPASIKGQLVRGFEGASVYCCWYDQTTRAHTDTDTAALTVKLAPLYKTLRGLT